MDKEASRTKRGQTRQQDDIQLSKLTNLELHCLMNDTDALKRTSAAKLLGERKDKEAVSILCERLRIETALYTRIAISEALGAIGEPAISGLIELLGKVGNNQHQELPQNGFYKKSYPLPRDIAVRTLTKIGKPALKPLEDVVLSGDKTSILEALDGIGHIAFYEDDLSSEIVLQKAYQKYQSDKQILWKIIRAFQSFPTESVRRLLEEVICSYPSPELRWEAVRSLGQHKRKVSLEIMDHIQLDPNDEVRKTARYFLKQ